MESWETAGESRATFIQLEGNVVQICSERHNHSEEQTGRMYHPLASGWVACADLTPVNKIQRSKNGIETGQRDILCTSKDEAAVEEPVHSR